MDQQTTSEQQRVPTAAPDAGSPPESPAPAASQQPTQTWGDRALRLLTSLLSGALVGLAAGALVLVVGGLGLRFVFVTMLEGGESALNLGFLLAIGCLLPATLLTALIVGLSALAPIHIVRSRIAAAGSLQAQRGDRAFSISCIGILAIGAWLAALGFAAYQVFPRVPREERVALAALYESADGGNWRNHTGWLSWWRSPCHWKGVGCHDGGFLTTHVTYINLRENQLSGSIPPELGRLSRLQTLNLDFNQLSGSIPPELGQLSSLERLALNHNQLSGGIPPELGNLSSIQALYLSNNQLSGAIPPELGNLTSLEDLSLANNQLSGSLPLELSNLSNMDEFNFDGTDLCEPAQAAFQEWLTEIRILERTGIACP